MPNGDHLSWVKPKLNSPSKDRNYKIAAGDLKSDPDTIKATVKTGSLKALTDALWGKITNTDSLDVKTIDDIRAYADKRGKKDKLDQHLLEFVTDAVVKAPIVLQIPDGSLYRVTGETRLSIARFSGVMPKVWLAVFKP